MLKKEGRGVVLKTGINLVSLKDAEKVVKSKEGLKKFFHKNELKNTKLESLAGILALKEAFFKALEIAPPKWLEIEVLQNKTRKPNINWNEGKMNNILSIDSSVNHNGEYAVATVTVLMRKEEKKF